MKCTASMHIGQGRAPCGGTRMRAGNAPHAGNHALRHQAAARRLWAVLSNCVGCDCIGPEPAARQGIAAAAGITAARCSCEHEGRVSAGCAASLCHAAWCMHMQQRRGLAHCLPLQPGAPPSHLAVADALPTQQASSTAHNAQPALPLLHGMPTLFSQLAQHSA